jgi:hypothetical protein
MELNGFALELVLFVVVVVVVILVVILVVAAATLSSDDARAVVLVNGFLVDKVPFHLPVALCRRRPLPAWRPFLGLVYSPLLGLRALASRPAGGP